MHQNKCLCKILISSFVALFACLMGGCGVTIPDLQHKDMELVTDYAAEKLLEHDTNNPSRLVDEEELLAKEAKDLEKKKKQEEREKRREELEKQVEAEREKLEKENENSSGGDSKPQEPVYSTDLKDLNSILGWPSEVYLQYVGMEVADSYPSNMGVGLDGVNSSDGNSLCILYFDIINTSDESRSISVNGMNTYFQMKINDGGVFNALSTILPDDLNLYAGTVEPIGGTVPRVVLLLDYPSSKLENVNSVVVFARHGMDSVPVKVK